MRVVFAASEAVPFCKTGGLADVAGALPRALARLGAEVSLFLPRYRGMRAAAAGATALPGEVRAELGGESVAGRVLRLPPREGVSVFLIDCPRYFDRPQLYGEDGRDYPDNAERFAFFCLAVLEGCRAAGLRPQILHGHDWQTGLLPVYRDLRYAADPELAAAARVFTIHNLAYQGVFPAETAPRLGLPWSEFTPERLEFYGRLNLLKGGLVASERINAVSPSYAREIRGAERGCGLEGVLNARAADLSGILNGLDTALWDPRADAVLAARYGPRESASGKRACKLALQRECGWPADPDAPVFGAVTRLDPQKGVDLALEVLPEFLARGARFALLGRGEPELERRCRELARELPDRFHYRSEFDDPFARRIYAGADLFLMPSRFEPCGLGQLIALRYGSLPVAVRTGGLADTVEPEGFLAEAAEPGALREAIARALAEHGRRGPWRARVRAAMKRDFGWEASARAYLRLYEEALAERNGAAR